MTAGDENENENSGRRLRTRLDSVSRRQFLGATGAGIVTLGGARAVHNTLLGYGHFGMGTNLLEQDLQPLFEARLSLEYTGDVDSVHVEVDAEDGYVAARNDGADETVAFDGHTAADARAVDDRFGLDGVVESLFEDVTAFRADEHTFEFLDVEQFFERVDEGVLRPHLVAAARGWGDGRADPDLVEAFTNVDPTDTEALVYGLKRGFREHGQYDVPRYVAGSIEDNVIFGATDLRRHFEDSVEFESLLENDGTGLFCWELVHRSMEAFHAVPPWKQTVPVAAVYVSDRRHKHAYTGLVTAIRDDGALRIPVTFIDYTYSTLYDDFRLTRLRGQGLDAYDGMHRADEVYWA